MKDRIEVVKRSNGYRDVLDFYYRCDLGRLYLHTWNFTAGVYGYFRSGRNPSELFCFRYGGNERLNKIVDRLPAYIRSARRYAEEEADHPAEEDAAAREFGNAA